MKIVHIEGDPHQCTVCSRIIANSYAFRTHMKSKHGIKGVSDVTNKYGRRLKDGTQKMHFENAHPEDVIKRFFCFLVFSS